MKEIGYIMTLKYGLSVLALTVAARIGTALGRETALENGPVRGTPSPEVWMCVGDIRQLLSTQDAGWSFVRKHLDGIKIYIGSLGGVQKRRVLSNEELRQFLTILAANKIKLCIECGGTLGFVPTDDSNGRESARRELMKIDRVYASGGTVDFLDMDGPVRRILASGSNRFKFGKNFRWQGFADLDSCVPQVLSYMHGVHERHPNIRFFALTNFPNWGYRGHVSYHARFENRQDWGDYFNVISVMLPAARAAGLPIQAVTVDNPYDYIIGRHRSATLSHPEWIDWVARIRDLGRYVESRRSGLNIILNSEKGGNTSDTLFAEETLKLLDLYTERKVTPKRWVVQSWYPHPKRLAPEMDAGTLTNLVKEVIIRVRGGPDKDGRTY